MIYFLGVGNIGRCNAVAAFCVKLAGINELIAELDALPWLVPRNTPCTAPIASSVATDLILVFL
jgi:hypothetical protein